jgi:hypothetical protein
MIEDFLPGKAHEWVRDQSVGVTLIGQIGAEYKCKRCNSTLRYCAGRRVRFVDGVRWAPPSYSYSRTMVCDEGCEPRCFASEECDATKEPVSLPGR